jgi:diaminopimelate decarboxylase
MDHFSYKNGRLFVESADVELIAQKVGTPAYIYSKATFLDHLSKIRKAYAHLDAMICFSVKACANINILKLLAQHGSGFDIVSGGELYRVLHAGGDPAKVVFAGVGKTDLEILEALNAGIAYFNIESEAELENLIRLVAQRASSIQSPDSGLLSSTQIINNQSSIINVLSPDSGLQTPRAALRVNPDVDYKTHAYLTTGKKQTKFGVDIERALKVFDDFGKNPHVNLCAIHVHLGTGGKTIDPYVEAVKKVLPLIAEIRSRGHTIEALDLGGGYGADYESDTVPSAADYAAGIVPLLKDAKLKLILEPGKSVCANAGILLTRVLYTKQSGSKNFVIVDAGMNDLIRPSLYDAFHFIWPTKVTPDFVPPHRAKELKMPGTEIVDLVGPICEGADFFAKDRALPPLKRGDLLAIFTAGAYGFTMSSNYNARPRAPEVLVDGPNFSTIRKRESYEDLIAPER